MDPSTHKVGNPIALEPVFFQAHAVRPVWHQGETWFVGRDVCDALGLSNSRDSLDKLSDDEKGVASTDTPGGKQDLTIISEAGVYRLVFSSRKASAEAFKRWLAHEVLPAIRKTGRYEAARTVAAAARVEVKDVNRIRFAKLSLVNVVMRLDALGVDAAAIDMAAVLDFGRRLNAIGVRT